MSFSQYSGCSSKVDQDKTELNEFSKTKIGDIPKRMRRQRPIRGLETTQGIGERLVYLGPFHDIKSHPAK